jgi:protein involved in temperature-dependent protein secretion
LVFFRAITGIEQIPKEKQVQTAQIKPYTPNPKLSAAMNAAKNKDNKNAIALYSDYLHENPNDSKSMIDLIRLLLLSGSYDIAEKLMETYRVKFSPDDFYLKEKARYLALTNQGSLALIILDKLLKKHPEDKELLTIQNYANTHKIPNLAGDGVSSAYIPPLEPLNKRSVNPLLVEASKALQAKQYPKAISFYRLYIKKNPQDRLALISLINLLLITGHYQEADQLLAVYKGHFSSDFSYLREKARYYALIGNKQESLAYLKPLLKNLPMDKDLIAIEQYALNHRLEQKKYVTPANVPEAQLPKPNVLIRTQPVPTTPKINPMLMAAEIAIKAKNPKQAISLYENYLKQYPNDKIIKIKLINLLLINAEYLRANQLLANYQQLYGKDDSYLREQARYYALTGNKNAALDIVDKLLTVYKNDKDLEGIKQYAITHEKKMAPKIQPPAKAFIPEKPLPPPNIAVPAQPTPKVNPLLIAAENAIKAKNLKQAISLYENYLKQYPNDKIIKIKLINLLLINAEYPRANQWLVNYQQLYGKDNSYLREQARYYALTGNKNAALDIVDKLLTVYKNDKDLEGIKQYAITHEKKRAPKIQPPVNVNPQPSTQNGHGGESFYSRKAITSTQYSGTGSTHSES